MLFLMGLSQPVAAQSITYPETLSSVPELRQKLTAVTQNLDQLQPMATDVVVVALRELDRQKASLTPELYARNLGNIYRLGLVLQQAHGQLQRLELQIEPGETESTANQTKQVSKWLTDRELTLLDAGPNLLNMLDNQAERTDIYKMVSSLYK